MAGAGGGCYARAMSRSPAELEERIAHLERMVDDLSDVVARQGRALDEAQRRIAKLMERAAEAEEAGGGGVYLADQKPPHW